MTRGGGLEMWTIFDHPADHPDRVVVRRFVVGPAPATEGRPAGIHSGDAHLCASVSEARKWLAGERPGLACLSRSPEDDPSVVETWL